MRGRITILAPVHRPKRVRGGFNLNALALEALPALGKIAHTGISYLFGNRGGRRGRGGGRTHGGRYLYRRK